MTEFSESQVVGRASPVADVLLAIARASGRSSAHSICGLGLGANHPDTLIFAWSNSASTLWDKNGFAENALVEVIRAMLSTVDIVLVWDERDHRDPSRTSGVLRFVTPVHWAIELNCELATRACAATHERRPYPLRLLLLDTGPPRPRDLLLEDLLRRLLAISQVDDVDWVSYFRLLPITCGDTARFLERLNGSRPSATYVSVLAHDKELDSLRSDARRDVRRRRCRFALHALQDEKPFPRMLTEVAAAIASDGGLTDNSREAIAREWSQLRDDLSLVTHIAEDLVTETVSSFVVQIDDWIEKVSRRSLEIVSIRRTALDALRNVRRELEGKLSA